MPPFRVVVRHTDQKHKDHAFSQIAGLFDDPEDIEEFVQAAKDADRDELKATNVSLPPEKRVRKRDHDHFAELQDLGYEYKVQELVVKSHGEDDAGNEVPTEHRWKDVS